MSSKLFQFLGASVFATSFLFAQGTGTGTPGGGTHTPPNPATMAQRQVARLTTLLTLTAAQQTQATTLFTSSLTADQATRTSMMTARQALNAAVKNNDAGGIEQAATMLGTLTAQQTTSDSKAQAAFLQLLTPDQLTKYNTLHGFGGMGGGPFGGGPGASRFHGR